MSQKDNEAAQHSYKSAGGVVVTEEGKVLVLVRPRRLGPDDRPEIRLPKGHIEPGETRREAALREVREESGLAHLEILTDLGVQQVEFTWRGIHYSRQESCFLMYVPSEAGHGNPEAQFERRWLGWADALTQLTFEGEKKWVQRAQIAWSSGLENVSDQNSEQTNYHPQVQQQIAIGEQE